MLRPLYRCVLRLHPSGFCKRFADEMLSIFDHTPGKAAAVRLLADGLLSLARQWTLRPEFWHEISPAQQPAPDGIPSFHTLDPFRPRASAVIHGLVLSTVIFCLTCFAIRYSWIHVLHVRIREVQFESPRSMQTNSGADASTSFATPVIPQRSENKAPLDVPSPPHSAINLPAPVPPSAGVVPNSAPQHPVAQSSAAGHPQPQGSANAQPAVRATAPPKRQLAANSARPSDLQSYSPQFLEHSGRPQPQALQPKAQNATRATLPTGIENVTLDAMQRQRVIHGAVANLTKYYIDPDVAQKMSDALLAHEKSGDDDAATDGEVFADLLTQQMMEVSHDKYLMTVYSTVATPENPPAPSPEEVARYRKEMEQNNCTIETVKILPHNIGYLKLNAFPDATICRTTIAAAMDSLNQADAIILDLRDNRGGYANTVALIATYLFDHPTHLNDFYNRSDNSTEQSWTLPPVPGNRLSDKPAFVLTSPTTFSAAEGFAYDLKMVKRATLVGETTSGRGHMGMGHRIDDHFTIRVPGIRVINPISKTNWEGTGVEPDVKVKAADALQAAQKLAESKLKQK
ncbi:MAG: S41 family peptidase [Candidatus Sulfotelmatobacter sp.]